MLKELDLPGIISLADTEPDFIEIFGKNEDQVNDWVEETKNRINRRFGRIVIHSRISQQLQFIPINMVTKSS